LKVLVCGSRDWTDEQLIARVLLGLTTERHVEIIHGGARGADRIAAQIASEFEFDVQTFPADWRAHGRWAGLRRNLQMLDENPDLVIAFQRNGSRGTQHTIDEARRRGIAVEVHTA
jgi:hypothetical protein